MKGGDLKIDLHTHCGEATCLPNPRVDIVKEIVDAVNSIIKEGAKEVDEKALSDHMYTAGLPDPDLVIRTSGAKRLSGLLPWQTVYSEIYFSEKLWPDFSREDFGDALRFYEKTQRRFGK